MMLKISNEIFFGEVERLIGEGKNVTITVKGNSMRPWLRDNRHKVVLTPCQSGTLQEGDIALFRYNGSHILHRITKISGEDITFAGDGNINRLERATRADVVAIASKVITPRNRTIDCTSREWRAKSCIWLALPQIARRCILGIMNRIE